MTLLRGFRYLLSGLFFGVLVQLLLMGVAMADDRNRQVEELWREYKDHFIQQDGRVIDRQQQDISHSESQGYGMILCVLFQDRERFEAIRRWTFTNLPPRGDGLIPWAWGRRVNGRWGVIDFNNATDGDLLIAWALLEAGELWQDQSCINDGRRLASAIREQLAVERWGGIYLLPGYFGFGGENCLVLNPSYQIFEAFRVLGRYDDKDFWSRVERDSRRLISESMAGPARLPPDWIKLEKGGTCLWEERPPLFGFEAIRYLLYILWDRHPEFPSGATRILHEFRSTGAVPMEVDLKTGNFSSKNAPRGFYAIYARIAEKMGDVETASRLWRVAMNISDSERWNYFSMTMLMLALRGGGQA